MMKKDRQLLWRVSISAIFFLGGFFLLLPTAGQAAELEQVKRLRPVATGEHYVKMKWRKVPRARFYKVKLLSKNKKKLRTVRVTGNQKRLKKLKPNRTYYVRVRAGRRAMRGPWSKIRRAKTNAKNPTPVIKNLIVDFERWDPATDRAGAFIFSAMEEKVFLEFGAVVIGPGGEKVLPTFEYRLDETADVYAPISGIVQKIFYQAETDDYEILFFATKDTNSKGVSVDHLTNITLSEGDAVKAGQVIGNPGTWNGEWGRTELMIYGNGQTYCPFDFFAKSLKTEYEQKVWDMMADWETFKGNDAIYNEAGMREFGAGCVAHTYDG